MTKFQSGRNKAITGRRNRCHPRNLPELPIVVKCADIDPQVHIRMMQQLEASYAGCGRNVIMTAPDVEFNVQTSYRVKYPRFIS